MQHFPASWVSIGYRDTLPAKIGKLLEPRFGKLEGIPTFIDTDGGIVATAVFQAESMAQKAVQKLHGIDTRTEAEKIASGYHKASVDQMFHVQLKTALTSIVTQ